MSQKDKPQMALQLEGSIPQCPDFSKLLSTPEVSDPLPPDFSLKDEAGHLINLWGTTTDLHQYEFNSFIHAGGSGMVFKVTSKETLSQQALKIARLKLFKLGSADSNGVARALSPVSREELLALQKISHPNVVRLYNAIKNDKGVIGISTTLVENPQPLDLYLRQTLAKHPDPTGKKGISSFSPQRLDDACAFILDRCIEIASAIDHMHKEHIFHFDIKPANILVSKNKAAILTDLGSCIHADDIQDKAEIRVHFTWTYGHPDLTSIVSDPSGISGGGLKASAKIAKNPKLNIFDLYSFGRTIQECLGILAYEFGERCYAAYGFRFLHLVASLLLDGRNAPSLKERVVTMHGRRFVNDVAMGYPTEIFKLHKIKSATELLDRLARYSRQYSWYGITTELDPWQPNNVNTGTGNPSPFTKRVAKVLNHPSLRRLKTEFQLGWMREVYPGATHNRWSHTIGVFSAVLAYYNALLADPEVPTLQVLLDPQDLSHAMMAAILHDIGQTDFAHDFEAACPQFYNHEKIVERLLDERVWGEPNLRETIKSSWPDIDIDRVLRILASKSGGGISGRTHVYRAVDGLASDIIDGPIDTDKYDYLFRDSMACNVPYGNGIDRERFLHALTVDAKEPSPGPARLALAYRSKGSPAIESLLLARYQMYGAVYWHHTYRCIQAMLVHAAAATFGNLKTSSKRIRNIMISPKLVEDLLYYFVICGIPPQACKEVIKATIPTYFFEIGPAVLNNERALEFLWKFSDDSIRQLIERLAARDLYKRVFEVKLGELGDSGDYSAVKSDLLPDKRIGISENISRLFLDSIHKSMAQKGPIVTATETEAKQRYDEIKSYKIPLVIIDFPVKGIPEEKNFPNEIGDASRKYLATHQKLTSGKKNVFHRIKEMQSDITSVRIFVAPELHELITRYLDPSDVQACVEDAIPRIKIHQ